MMLLVTMLLARRVASHTPSLLRTVFHTTVNFINQNLLTCVRNLVGNVSSLALPCTLLVSACSPHPSPELRTLTKLGLRLLPARPLRLMPRLHGRPSGHPAQADGVGLLS